MNNPRIPERREFLSGVAALSLLGLAGCGGGGGGGGNTAVGGSLPPTGVASVGTLRLPPALSGNTISTAAGAYNLGTGAQSGALLYNAQWPAPLIRISGFPQNNISKNRRRLTSISARTPRSLSR